MLRAQDLARLVLAAPLEVVVQLLRRTLKHLKYLGDGNFRRISGQQVPAVRTPDASYKTRSAQLDQELP